MRVSRIKLGLLSLLLVLTSSCSSSEAGPVAIASAASPTAPATRQATSPSASVSSTASPETVTIDDLVTYRSPTNADGGFQTPSGHVRCYFESADDADWITCDVVRHPWVLPHCRNAELSTVFLDTSSHERPTLGCSAGPRQTYRVLPYGHSLSDMTIDCQSSQDGLTCRSQVTRHGFRVSRTAYHPF